MIGIVTKYIRNISGFFAFCATMATVCLTGASPAFAQGNNLQGSGALVRQDSSDCGNSTVNDNDPSRRGGAITITQTPAGATTANVEIFHGTPNTSYNFYWKCQRQLGTIQTDGSGGGTGSFQFQATAGQPLTFDMYPDGAPAGNKFQSMPIAPLYVGVGPLVRQDFSDCGNNNVNAADPTRVGGNVIVLQNAAGATTVNVEMSAGTPNTSYTIYWKCQRALGNVQTDGNGAGTGSFQLQTTPGTVLTFDMYPAGAPAGNKYQSVRVLPAPATARRATAR
jgi:hypothetical protein